MFSSIEEAIEDLRLGKTIIIIDDEDRENEGDFVCAAELITPETVNFMITEGKGLLCVAAADSVLDRIGIPLMVGSNSALHGTQFTVSVDVKKNTTTGISAADRTTTIRKLADPSATREDFGIPGHIFPLRAAGYGVLKRSGHTEAVVDLCRLAGLQPVGALCEVLNTDGSMARTPELLKLAEKHTLKVVTVHQLFEYRLRTESIIKKLLDIKLPTEFGVFQVHLYKSLLEEREHLAFVKGDISGSEPVLTRIHSECLTGDVFHSMKCDCQQQLQKSFDVINETGRGILIYLRQEGRGIGLVNKLLAYRLQEEGKDTVEANLALGFKADERNYASAAQILKELGVKSVDLLTNNPDKIKALQKFDLNLHQRIPLEIVPNSVNINYLRTKRDKMGHLILQEEFQDKTT
ncbi:MAG: bifunctional 3,4-dihydroxy-2-butanone-4-phosphate synthase/GTP cyclohydrolase II [Ignavibacteriaceae bacterium]|nr:bifunctional 3,4-dihydroxy-2-butanone-4-phosphate synthase/GTP cyclohydrolase II [Ignavibacteriaceae bacterium]